MRHHQKTAARAARSVSSRKGLALSVALGLAAVPVVAFAPMAAAIPTPSCVVSINGGPATKYANLGAAVGVAASGNTLNVESTCTGDTTISKNLTITGSGSGQTLQGGNSSLSPGTVVTVSSGVSVTISKLDITGGYSAGNGGGINNAGSLTLSSDGIYANTAASGGGGIFNTGAVIQNPADTSGVSVTHNKAANGGGVYNDGSTGGIDNTATLTLTNASINGNTATGYGGGVYNDAGSAGGAQDNTATVTLRNTSVNNNTAANGGGVYNNGGSGAFSGWYAPDQLVATVALNNASVNGNTATSNGGGIYNDGGSGLNSGPNVVTVALNGTSVNGNKAANGGGIYNDGGTGGFSQYWGNTPSLAGNTVTVTLSNSGVASNTASANGGGIYNDGGSDTYGNGDTATVTFANATGTSTGVSSNKATQGGGIYNTNHGGAATVTLDTHTSVNKNTATLLNGGGGILNVPGSTLNGAVAPPASAANVYNNTAGGAPNNID